MRTAKSQMAGSPIVITSADQATDAWTVYQAHGYAVQAFWPNGLVGTLKVQATIKGDPNWSDIEDTDVAVSGAGSFIWNFDNGIFYDAFRVYFVYTSGSGSIEVWAESKGP